MKNNLGKLGNTAWVTGVIFAGICLFMVISMFALSNPEWSVVEAILTILASVSYITGLLIAKKWPLTGGLLSFILPVAATVAFLCSLREAMNSSPDLAPGYRKTAFRLLILMLPGVLHLIYWWLKRRADKAVL